MKRAPSTETSSFTSRRSFTSQHATTSHLVRLFVELRSSGERNSKTASLTFTAKGIPYQILCRQNLFWSLLWPRYSTLQTPPSPVRIVCVDSNEGTFILRVRPISGHCSQGLRSVGGPTRSISTHWGRVTQICVFNTRLFSLHKTLNL